MFAREWMDFIDGKRWRALDTIGFFHGRSGNRLGLLAWQ
jgi:hypothetical protein